MNEVGWTEMWDDDADGVVDYEIHHQATFDAHGNLLVEVDEQVDGPTVLFTVTTRYEY
jgi:hypothetical protein